jgi:aspartate/methionine/tyrosine aminotransferase
MFSSRVPPDLHANDLARALRVARAASRPLLDLTTSNPTCAGLEYPNTLLAHLHAPEGLVYEPSPFGHLPAREAVARDYARRGVSISPDRIVLTSSTSEAYSLLFKLLCEPSGDSVLTPTPSYPLFEHLTRLDGVSPAPYALEYHGRWMVDAASVEAAWTTHTRAVLAVSPNNPTGSFLSAGEEGALSDLCASRGAALIVDEVFADYPFISPRPRQGQEPTTAGLPHAPRRAANSPAACLTFRLGGLSKSAGLPQVKLGWIAVDGPAAHVEKAMERLEFICDAYLSVSTPVQVAAPRLIEEGAVVRTQILQRVRSNFECLRGAVERRPSVDLLHAEAGWSAILRVPSRRTEAELVIDLLELDSVVVHPGYFFDFACEAFLIVSLLPPPAIFEEGVTRLLERSA